MNIDRLKFAWARGARIQTESYVDRERSKKTCWIAHRLDDPLAYAMLHRIHPKDAHLEYGPLSSALRNHAEKGMDFDYEDVYCWAAMDLMLDVQEPSEIILTGKNEWILGRLFFAEYLADQGL